ncbi:MAG: universal stress protein [Promethearchaeati archaeon SRVP18_Atabeyarchaeia-1]
MGAEGEEKLVADQGDEHANKILIPLGPTLDKPKMAAALQALSSFRNPLLVLFHVIELPSRTAPLDSAYYDSEFKEAEKKYLLDATRWLKDQGYHVQTKVAVAREVTDGIIVEANNGEYVAVLLLKRRAEKGFLRRHRSVSEKVSRYVECLVITQLVGEAEKQRSIH